MTATFRPGVVMVTGGAGFIGSNLVRWLLENVPGVAVVNYDLLTYAGNRESLTDVERRFGGENDGRYFFVHGDIRDASSLAAVLAGDGKDSLDHRPIPRPEAVFHLAAETHVDRSIVGPAAFVSTNVQGTLSLLEAVKQELAARPRDFRFINVSTDEVYGSLRDAEPAFTEQHPLQPNNPYSASKAGADCLVRAYVSTYGLPCITTRCSNNYGPYQLPEKLVPCMIIHALAGEPLPLYGDGAHVRDWLHVLDHAQAIWRVCLHGRIEDEVYNIGGNSERANIDVVREILGVLGQPDSLIEFVPERPGHDRRYAMNATRIHELLGWAPAYTFERGLRETITWYAGNERWWKPVQREAHRRPNHSLR